MDNNIKLEKYYSKENFERLKEVMNILGLAFPKDYEIKYDVFGDLDEWNAWPKDLDIDDSRALYIVLQENSKPNERERLTPFENPNYIRLFKNKIRLTKNSNDKNYVWEKENNKETFTIGNNKKDSIKTTIEILPKSFYTSKIRIEKNYTYNSFYSTGKTVNLFNDINYPIFEYYNVIKEFVNSKEFDEKYNISNNEEINKTNKKLILSFIETPIKNVLKDLANNDQKERVDSLLRNYRKEYYAALREAKRRYELSRKHSEKTYLNDKEIAQDAYQSHLELIKKEYKKY